MWVLQLNDMRSPKIEILRPVARGETKEDLEALIESEKVERYQDGNWGKTFKKDGLLEWCNGPRKNNDSHFVHVGDEETFIAKAREQFQTQIMVLPEAPTV